MTVPWVELFAVFVVCHLGGDFILQTEFQAKNKHGGLGRDPVRRRALGLHVLTYTACYVPVIVWLAGDVSVGTLGAILLGVGVPHGLQDDGTAMKWWIRRVKHTEPQPGVLAMLVDQSFHVVALLILAVLVGV